MGINKYNSEGYYDPTVYEALVNIEKAEKSARRVYRPLVYICSPYAGDVERNVNMAGHTAALRYGIPVFPLPLTCSIRSSWMTPSQQSGNLPCSWEWCCSQNVSRCGCSAASYHRGCGQRLRKRKKEKIPVRYFTEELEEMPCAN